MGHVSSQQHARVLYLTQAYIVAVLKLYLKALSSEMPKKIYKSKHILIHPTEQYRNIVHYNFLLSGASGT